MPCPKCIPLGSPPGTGKHHPDCPCCHVRRKMLWACRSIEGLRGARVQDATIRRLLEREGIEAWIIDDALAWEGENPPMRAAYPAV
jgi:hypothetical protein